MYIFAVKADQSRAMWQSAFRYVIASTNAIQSILQHKTERIDEKIKILTKNMNENEEDQ